MKVQRQNKVNTRVLDLPEINKIGADDYNELKEVINTNDDEMIGVVNELESLGTVVNFLGLVFASISANGVVLSSSEPITCEQLSVGEYEISLIEGAFQAEDVVLLTSSAISNNESQNIADGKLLVSLKRGASEVNAAFSFLAIRPKA